MSLTDKYMEEKVSPAASTPEVQIVHIHMEPKKDFMSLQELISEIPYGKTWVMEQIKRGLIREEEHFIQLDRKLIFYYPAVSLLFKPKLAKV